MMRYMTNPDKRGITNIFFKDAYLLVVKVAIASSTYFSRSANPEKGFVYCASPEHVTSQPLDSSG